MDQAKKDLIIQLLGDENDPVKPEDIVAVAQEEGKRKARAAELAKAPKHPPMADADWADYKAYLLDHQGGYDQLEVYREALSALKEDRQPDFWTALDLLFKRTRMAYFSTCEL